jgi:hypothetical protein
LLYKISAPLKNEKESIIKEFIRCTKKQWGKAAFPQDNGQILETKDFK